MLWGRTGETGIWIERRRGNTECAYVTATTDLETGKSYMAIRCGVRTCKWNFDSTRWSVGWYAALQLSCQGYVDGYSSQSVPLPCLCT